MPPVTSKPAGTSDRTLFTSELVIKQLGRDASLGQIVRDGTCSRSTARRAKKYLWSAALSASAC